MTIVFIWVPHRRCCCYYCFVSVMRPLVCVCCTNAKKRLVSAECNTNADFTCLLPSGSVTLLPFHRLAVAISSSLSPRPPPARPHHLLRHQLQYQQRLLRPATASKLPCVCICSIDNKLYPFVFRARLLSSPFCPNTSTQLVYQKGYSGNK